MNKLDFRYDVKKDLQNYENNYLDHKYPDYGRKDLDTAPFLWPSLKRKIDQAADDDKKVIIEDYLNNFAKNELPITIEIGALRKYWSSLEAEYFKRLCDYMKIPNDVGKMTVYFTTLSMSPYSVSNRHFYVSFFSNLPSQIKTIMHETMHIIFRSNYENDLIKRGADKQAILEVTEALTILLNYEFSNLLIVPEKNNKPSTKDLQDKVVDLWKQKVNFLTMLDELIKMRT